MSATHPASNLIPYLRGELSGHESEGTAAHLAGCIECRNEAAMLEQTLRLVARQVEELPVPDWTAFRAELRRKLSAREARAPRWWQPTFVLGGLATAAVAAIALLTVVALHRGNRGVPTVEPDVLALADAPDIRLLRDYPMVERMDMLGDDNYDLIQHLDELAPTSQTHEIQRL